MNVEKPVQRSKAEAINKLEELGKENPDIAAVSRNSSQYPEDMLAALANNPEMADFEKEQEEWSFELLKPQIKKIWAYGK